MNSTFEIVEQPITPGDLVLSELDQIPVNLVLSEIDIISETGKELHKGWVLDNIQLGLDHRYCIALEHGDIYTGLQSFNTRRKRQRLQTAILAINP